MPGAAAGEVADEAVDLYAKLVAAGRNEHVPGYTLARHTRGTIWSHPGRHEDALRESTAVVTAYRRLDGTDPYGTAADPARHAVDHARALAMTEEVRS